MMSEKTHVIDARRCKSCGLCVEACPKGVLAIGQGINGPAQMEGIIASGQADVVYMARALLAERKWWWWAGAPAASRRPTPRPCAATRSYCSSRNPPREAF